MNRRHSFARLYHPDRGLRHLPALGSAVALQVAGRLHREAQRLAKHWKGKGTDQAMDEALAQVSLAFHYCADLALEALVRREPEKHARLVTWTEDCHGLLLQLLETRARRELKGHAIHRKRPGS